MYRLNICVCVQYVCVCTCKHFWMVCVCVRVCVRATCAHATCVRAASACSGFSHGFQAKRPCSQKEILLFFINILYLTAHFCHCFFMVTNSGNPFAKHEERKVSGSR